MSERTKHHTRETEFTEIATGTAGQRATHDRADRRSVTREFCQFQTSGCAFFIGAVVIAHQLGAAQTTLDRLAAAYVVLRVIYIVLYIRGLGTARSAVWALAFAVNIAMLFAGR